MNDEIKEILDRLDFNEWEVDLYKVPITWSELYDIRDYITDLQEENERLNTELNGYKSRCEKAIEFIMTELITEWDIKNDGYVSGSDLPVDAITPILNILGGDVQRAYEIIYDKLKELKGSDKDENN